MITFYRLSEPPEFPRIPLEGVSFPVLNAAFGAFMVEAGVEECRRPPIASKQVSTDVEEQDGDGDATFQPDDDGNPSSWRERSTDLLVQLHWVTFSLESVSAALQNASPLLRLRDSV